MTSTSRSRPAARSAQRARVRRGWQRDPRWWIGIAAVVGIAVVGAVVLADGDESGDDRQGGAAGGFTGGDFHSIVADPTVPGRLFVGGHQAVAVSNDTGRSWSPVASLENADAMGWAFDGGSVWVSGHPGINLSTDGAATFSRRNDGLPDTDVHAFGAGGGVLYGAGPNLGVIASSDDGATWEQRSPDIGGAFFGRILVDPLDADHLVAADAQVGPVESRDGGRRWSPLGSAPASWVSSPDGLTTLYASSPDGAVRSVDGGATWQPLELPEGASLVEADPTTTDRAYAGVHADGSVRVWVSEDAGTTWAPA